MLWGRLPDLVPLNVANRPRSEPGLRREYVRFVLRLFTGIGGSSFKVLSPSAEVGGGAGCVATGSGDSTLSAMLIDRLVRFLRAIKVIPSLGDGSNSAMTGVDGCEKLP